MAANIWLDANPRAQRGLGLGRLSIRLGDRPLGRLLDVERVEQRRGQRLSALKGCSTSKARTTGSSARNKTMGPVPLQRLCAPRTTAASPLRRGRAL